MRRARGALIVSASISFLTPAELAGGLALKESRYEATNAFDSPLGEKSPHLVPPPFPMDGKGSAMTRVSISIGQDIACDGAPDRKPGPIAYFRVKGPDGCRSDPATTGCAPMSGLT